MIRDVQRSQAGENVQLMPGEERLQLPPIEEYSKSKDGD
jgi:hypothetical protein